jgi:ATP-dependent Clp protease ATP-binding subunit ClpC
VFELFTDRARRVVVDSQVEARRLGSEQIDAAHILLGVIHEPPGVGAQALQRMGISLDPLREQLRQLIGRGAGTPQGQVPYTSGAKKVLEFSQMDALTFAHNYIGTEHLLLGVIREGDGAGAQVLAELGADLAAGHAAVAELLKTVPPEHCGWAASDRASGPGCPWCQAPLAGSGAIKTIDLPQSSAAASVSIFFCKRCGSAISVLAVHP